MYFRILTHTLTKGPFIFTLFWQEMTTVQVLIKTITKFSNMIGYQQHDLSANLGKFISHSCNWTV